MGRKKRREAKRAKHEGTREALEDRHVHRERVAAAEKRRQRKRLTWAFVVVAILLGVLVLYGLWPKPSPYQSFAECLTESGAIMYGADWCSNCQAQKRDFGAAFKQITYENCDYGTACDEKGVTGYPTWILGDGSRLIGHQPLATLAAKSGCQLPE